MHPAKTMSPRLWARHYLLLAMMTTCLAGTALADELTMVPAGLDIPADFTPGEADYADGSAKGKFLGVARLRGRELKPISGVQPIQIILTPEGRFGAETIQVGDLIIAIDGKPLVLESAYTFKAAMSRVQQNTGFVSVTRWRAGDISTITLDLNTYPPDLTKGEAPTNLHDWQLGPTGMNGWVYSEGIAHGASAKARQILVTLVEPGSPADGVIEVGDVILGVNGTPFSSDARRALAAAIVEAEREAHAGQLSLLVWRGGEQLTASLTLATFPEPGATAPYDCAKTEAIIDAACDYLKTKKLQENWLGYIDALGMLATGREDLMPQLKAFAHEICVPGEVLNIQTHEGMLCWKWSYKTLFLTEYFLATGDAYVLPTIEEYATKIAMGQSGVGSWGHTVAARENTGSLLGHLGGYGAINQMGLTLMIALPLAQKCGITNDEIRDAIRRGETFFSYYIDKGAIPYGDHAPNTAWFDDNGKSGSAAVMFDLLGNEHGSQFFASMVLGSAPSGREAGHTGCYWSHLWGGVGAARTGREGMITFMREMDWAFTLERHASGRFSYQGNAGEGGDSGKAKTTWDSTGARLLQLCVPRQRLYVTGRESTVTTPLTTARIESLTESGWLSIDRAARNSLSREDILELLGDEMPAVRMIAAQAMKSQQIEMVDTLVAMLDSENRYARYGACHALRESGYGSAEAVARLVELIETADDLDLRLNALNALTGDYIETSLAPAAKDAIPALLKLAVQRFEIDPRRLLQQRIAFALFSKTGLITLHGIEDLDSAILIPAIRELLTVDDGAARGAVGSVFDRLTDDQRQALWGDIYQATRDMPPSGIMFADVVRERGLTLMMNHRVEEGVDLTLGFMQENRWGAGTREKAGLDVLKGYGPMARRAYPYLETLYEKWAANKKTSAADLAKLQATMTTLQAGEPVAGQSIAPYIE